MSDESKATTGPWFRDGLAVSGKTGVVCLMGEPAQYPGDTATMFPNAEADAALIVRAVNRDHAFDAMKEALEAYEAAIDEAEAIFGGEYADHYGPMFELAMKARDKRRAALRLASGEEQ